MIYSLDTAIERAAATDREIHNPSTETFWRAVDTRLTVFYQQKGATLGELTIPLHHEMSAANAADYIACRRHA
jgi:hypothetical protein